MAVGEDEVRVEVAGVFGQRVDVSGQEQRVPLVLLKDVRNREVRVPIGSCEGLAVHVAVQQQAVARPLTHDLAVRLLETLSASLTRVVIHDRSDGTFRARLYLQSAQGEVAVEGSAGDAVALALRVEAPIHVMESAFTRANPSGDDIV